MTVSFWGVRGSMPATGADFARYGGNTTAVAVACDGRVLVLDAGTGIRPLGRALAGGTEELFLLLTHLHADHVHGFPFFAPLYESGRKICLLDYDGGWSPLALFDGRHYPLQPQDLPAEIRRVAAPGLGVLADCGIEVRRQAVNHPGGAYGYRVEHGGRAFVFIPDDELHATDGAIAPEEVVAFCAGADVLCHDAQYLAAEAAIRRGWGHSTVEETCALAVAAGARHLVLTHHDPDRTDDAIDAIEGQARAFLAPHGIACTAAYEGLVIDFDGTGAPAPRAAVSTRAEGA